MGRPVAGPNLIGSTRCRTSWHVAGVLKSWLGDGDFMEKAPPRHVSHLGGQS